MYYSNNKTSPSMMRACAYGCLNKVFATREQKIDTQNLSMECVGGPCYKCYLMYILYMYSIS